MSRFLVAMWEGGGTVPPMLGIARRLVARGHEVTVLADPTIRAEAEGAGCGFLPWRNAPHRTTRRPEDDVLKDWEASNPVAMLRRLRDRLVAGPAPAYVADTLDALERSGPDAVAADYMLFGAIMAAESAGLPVAALVPNVWPVPTPGVPAFGPGFLPARTILGRTRDALVRAVSERVLDGALPSLNATRRSLGLPPLRSFFEQCLRCDEVLVLTSAAFDFGAPFVPPHVRYVGAVLDDPAWAQPWTPPWPARSDDPLVLVGFSSTFQDQAGTLRRVVEALAGLPVRALVTLGEMLEEGAVQPAGAVAVVRSVPHREVLPHASVLVTHCGHGTTLKGLAAGVPMVCMPMGRDQNDTAARVVHAGAGVRIRPMAPARRIRAAVLEVLRDERYRRAARRLAGAIEEEQRTLDPAAELERFAARAPRPSRRASASG